MYVTLGEVLRGEIWAGIEEGVERSLSPVDLKLRDKGQRGHHLGQHQRMESKASTGQAELGDRRDTVSARPFLWVAEPVHSSRVCCA